jgi:hypothetical protein
MVIGRDFVFLETRDTFPDGSCVPLRRFLASADALADMCALACLWSTLLLLPSVGAFFCFLHSLTHTTSIFVSGKSSVISFRYVRGAMLPSGWILKPLKGNEWDVFYIAQINPMGWLPPAVVNAVCGDAALCISALRKLL